MSSRGRRISEGDWVKEECDLAYHLKNINLSAIVPQEGKPGSKTKQNSSLEAIAVKFHKNNGGQCRVIALEVIRSNGLVYKFW